MSRKLLNAAALGLTSAVISRGSVLAAMLILAHKLPMKSFGVFSLGYITATSFGLFIAAGISQSAGALMPRVDELDVRKRAANLTAYQYLAVLLCSISGLIVSSTIYFAQPASSRSLSLAMASGLVLVSVGFAQSFQGILYATGRHREAAIGIIIGSAIFLVIILLMRDHLSPVVALLLIGSGSFTTCLINFRAIRREISPRLNFSDVLREFPAIRKSLYPLLATASLGSPVHSLCIAMLASSTNGVTQVAMFAASFQFYTVVTFIPSVIANVALPFFSKGASLDMDDAEEKSNVTFKLAVNLVITIAVLLSGMMLFASEHLLNWILPARFAGAASTIQILVLAAAVTSISVLFQQKINGSHLFWLNFLLALLYSVAYLTLTLVFVKHSGMGSVGLAAALLTAFTLLLVTQIMAHKLSRPRSGLFLSSP